MKKFLAIGSQVAGQSSRSALIAGVALFVAHVGCGGASANADAPEPPPSDDGGAISSPKKSAGGGEASDSELKDVDGAGSTEPATDDESDLEELARNLIKRPGRRVAFSDGKGFAVSRETVEGGLFTVDVVFVDTTGHETENVRICDPAECDEQLNELAKKKIPVLAERFEREGYRSIRAMGWPGHNELAVSALNAKLKFENRKLSAEVDGKSQVLGTLPAKRPVLIAVFPVPESKLIGAYVSADESGANKEFIVFKVK